MMDDPKSANADTVPSHISDDDTMPSKDISENKNQNENQDITNSLNNSIISNAENNTSTQKDDTLNNSTDIDQSQLNQQNEIINPDQISKEIHNNTTTSSQINNSEKENPNSTSLLSNDLDTSQIPNQIQNQPPISISEVSEILNSKNDSIEQNAENEDNQNILMNNSLNANSSIQNSNPAKRNQNFYHSFSANVFSGEKSKKDPTAIRRQISINNIPDIESPLSLSQLPNHPLKTQKSVPTILIHNNSVFSSQQQYIGRPFIPVVTPNNYFSLNQQQLGAQENANQGTQEKRHHRRHHRKKSRETAEQKQAEICQAAPKTSLYISPDDLQEILQREDEPELDLNPLANAALETFKKTGKLRFNLPIANVPNNGGLAADNGQLFEEENGEDSNYQPKIIRKLQRDKVNAIIQGRYDEAKEADALSKKVTTAVFETAEEDRRYKRLRNAELKLESEKKIFSDFHYECLEKVKAEEEALNSRMESLEGIHQSELKEFENKWNSEDFLRRFSKPSASLLELKAVERSMVIAKMFDEAKVVKSRAEQLEKIETREQQSRAESEMKVERKRLLERQKRETISLKEKCQNLLNIAKKNMEKEESPYKARIAKLEILVNDLKNGNENKCKIVPAMIQPVVSPRGSGNELFTARTAYKFSAYKATSQSMKLKIKPLGCVVPKEKKKTKVSKVEKH